MDYETETRRAYRSAARAQTYTRYQSSDWSWGRVATWREQQIIRRVLAARTWRDSDAVLDAPCGTGILAPTLAPYTDNVLATDISLEMMQLAMRAYFAAQRAQFVQADINAMPFPND